MLFHDITLSAGSKRSARRQDTAKLKPAAVAVFTDMIRQHGPSFRAPLPVKGLSHIELHWTVEEGVSGIAMATFWVGKTPLTTSVLMDGSSPEDEPAAIEAFQAMVTKVFHQTPVEPGFALADLTDRPVIVSLPWPVGPQYHKDMSIIADAETCLMAAFLTARKDE